MDNQAQINDLWASLEGVPTESTEYSFLLGETFYHLRGLYFRRRNGAAAFERQVVKRGFDQRTVQQWIDDFEREPSEPSTSERTNPDD